MLLKLSDLGPGQPTRRAPPGDLYSQAVDERQPERRCRVTRFKRGVVTASSAAQVQESIADANVLATWDERGRPALPALFAAGSQRASEPGRTTRSRSRTSPSTIRTGHRTVARTARAGGAGPWLLSR